MVNVTETCITHCRMGNLDVLNAAQSDQIGGDYRIKNLMCILLYLSDKFDVQEKTMKSWTLDEGCAILLVYGIEVFTDLIGKCTKQVIYQAETSGVI